MPELRGVIRHAREGGGGGGALVELDADLVAALGGAKRLRVKGTLNDVAFESNTMPMGGGRLCLGVHKATREAAGVTFGDEVRIVFELDDAPRTVEVPDELAAALAEDADARAVFDRVAFTHRREYVTWINEAKRPATRARRVAETLVRLRARPAPASTPPAGSAGTSTWRAPGSPAARRG